MTDEILEKLLEFICRNFMVDRELIELDKSLIDTGIIDSVGLISIAAYMKREYGIKLKDGQMNRDNFGSVLKIVAFIEKERTNGIKV